MLRFADLPASTKPAPPTVAGRSANRQCGKPRATTRCYGDSARPLWRSRFAAAGRDLATTMTEPWARAFYREEIGRRVGCAPRFWRRRPPFARGETTLAVAGSGVADDGEEEGSRTCRSWRRHPIEPPWIALGSQAAQVSRNDALNDDHAPAAVRADAGFPGRLGSAAAGVIEGGGLVGEHGDGEKLAAQLQIGLALAVGEQPVIADAVKAVRQDMEQETADELLRG